MAANTADATQTIIGIGNVLSKRKVLESESAKEQSKMLLEKLSAIVQAADTQGTEAPGGYRAFVGSLPSINEILKDPKLDFTNIPTNLLGDSPLSPTSVKFIDKPKVSAPSGPLIQLASDTALTPALVARLLEDPSLQPEDVIQRPPPRVAAAPPVQIALPSSATSAVSTAVQLPPLAAARARERERERASSAEAVSTAAQAPRMRIVPKGTPPVRRRQLPPVSAADISAAQPDEEKKEEDEPAIDFTAPEGFDEPTTAIKVEPGSAVSEAFDFIVNTQSVPPFEQGEFTVNNIRQFWNDNSSKNEWLNKEGSLETFEALVASVLEPAVRENDSNKIFAIFSTLGIASAGIKEDSGSSPNQLLEAVIADTFPVKRLLQLRGKVLQPVDIGRLITELFDVPLADLSRRSLSQEEIRVIRIQFQNDLLDLENSIKNDEGDFIFGSNTFQMLQEYINTHVENGQLRQLLLGDIQRRISADRDKLGIQLGEAPPILTPLSATRTQVLRDPQAEAISRVFGNQIVNIRNAQAKLDALGRRKKNKLQQAQDARVRDTIEVFNKFAERNQIRDPRTGFLITIPTEIRREISETTDVFEPRDPISLPSLPSFGQTGISALLGTVPKIDPLAPKVFRNVPIPTVDLIRQLENLTDVLGRKTQSFENVPVRITDRTSGETREQIIQDLITSERMFMKMRGMRPQPRKSLISSISKRAGLRNIEIMSARRRRVTMQEIKGIRMIGANMREIRIKSDATLAEYAKIANMIAMENGSLETIHEVQILDVIKGVTTIQEIVTVLMEQHNLASGKDFSVIFVPANPMGGMFLDGALSMLMKNRMLVSPVGGDIFSSIFNTIGNVVSVPLSLVGSVLGGGLEKPLQFVGSTMVNGRLRSVRPIVRRKTAPQTGGAITDVFGSKNNTFVQGEHQPEPFGLNQNIVQSSSGDANQFHILPFPLGGRIDNTGFIDQSQVNPKFAWGDIPVNKLTYFR